MNDDHSSPAERSAEPFEELIELLKEHDVDSEPIRCYLDRHQGTEYFGEVQGVLDIKELLRMGLIV